MAQKLMASLQTESVALVLDPESDGPPTGLRTAMRAWSSVPDGATHHLLLQDDAVLSPGFIDRVRDAVRAVPDAALAFYTHWQSRNGASVRQAVLSGHCWAPATSEYTPTVALLLPSEVAEGFAGFVRRHGATWADDVVMSRYLRAAGVPTYLAAPNLANHADVPSTHANGSHGPRRSACFAGMPEGTCWGLERGLATMDAIPFFKQGRAQVVVRVEDRWTTIAAHRYLARIGLDSDDCLKQLSALLADAPEEVAALARRLKPSVLEAHWQTTFLMGVVNAARRMSVTRLTNAEHMDLALGTVGAGGLCTQFGDAELAEMRPGLLAMAWAGHAAGTESGRRLAPAPTGGGPAKLTNGNRIVIHDPARLLGLGLARILADYGWEIYLRHGAQPRMPEYPGVTEVGPDGELDGVTAEVHVVEQDFEEHADTLAGVQNRAAPRHIVLVLGRGAESQSEGPSSLEEIVLRLGLVYGPGVRGDTPLEDAVWRSLLARSIRLPADRGQLWRPVFIDDVADAVQRVLQRPFVTGCIDICGPVGLRAHQMAEAVSRSVRRVHIELTAPEGRSASPLSWNLTRAMEELGWQPSTALEEGLHAWSQWLAYESDERG